MVLLQQALDTLRPDPVSLALLDWISQQEQDLRTGYERYQKYYEGVQDVPLTDRIKAFAQRSGLNFRDNFCAVVADVLSERLDVIGFASLDEDLSSWAWEVWQSNRMDGVQTAVHTGAAVKGDAYVLVDWDGEKPRLTFHDADLIVPHYDPDTLEIAWASKKWSWQPEIGKVSVTRLNLYFPERIEKYVLRQGLWNKFQDEGDVTWPLAWEGADGPIGVPLIHFANKASRGSFGMSELSDIIPLQDLLNKTLVDLLSVLDLMAFPQRWALGIEGGDFDVVPGNVWMLKSTEPADARMGEFTPASPDGLLRSIETFIQHVSALSRIPQHLFHLGNNFPSGEALKTAESGLVRRLQRRQVELGNAWEDAMALAQRVQNAFGEAITSPEILETTWDSVETRNDLLEMQALTAKAGLGVPRHQLWREMGYSADEIEQMDKDVLEAKVQDSNIGAEILKRFSSGEEGQT